jgi:outer membrane lipoprotein carrier protein
MKNRFRYVMIVAAAGIFLSPILRAQDEGNLTAPQVLEKVQDKYNSIKDMSAKFDQTVTLKYANIVQSFSGSLMMKKGKMYKIESQQQTIVTDGKTVWAYSPINHEVLIDKYNENTKGFSPDRFLFDLPENYSAVFIQENDAAGKAAYVLKLLPKQPSSSLVKNLKLWVDNTDWSVHKIEYVDMNDTKTDYVLSDIKFNSDIPDGDFTFTIPPNTQVVDMRNVEKK